MDKDENYALAGQIDLPDGRRIWIPEKGRPFWAHLNPPVDLSDSELSEHRLSAQIEEFRGRLDPFFIPARPAK